MGLAAAAGPSGAAAGLRQGFGEALRGSSEKAAGSNAGLQEA